MREIRNATLSGQPRPKVFYILPKRDEALTLEKDLKSLYYIQESPESPEDKTKVKISWIIWKSLALCWELNH